MESYETKTLDGIPKGFLRYSDLADMTKKMEEQDGGNQIDPAGIMADRFFLLLILMLFYSGDGCDEYNNFT